MTLTRPNGDIEELTTLLTKSGVYDTILVESWLSGDYTLEVSYDGHTISDLTFYIGEIKSDTSSVGACPTGNCVSIESDDDILSSPIMIVIAGD